MKKQDIHVEKIKCGKIGLKITIKGLPVRSGQSIGFNIGLARGKYRELEKVFGIISSRGCPLKWLIFCDSVKSRV